MENESNGLVSEANGALQESTQSASVTSSGEAAAVQERKSGEAAGQADLDARLEQVRKEVAEQVRREEQSKRDKMLHQLQMQIEAQAKRDAEEALRRKQEEEAVAQMDDEDFGRYMRQKAVERAKAEAIEAERARAAEEERRRTLLTIREKGYAQVPESLREELARREQECKTVEDFQAAVVDILAEHRVKQRLEKELEARTKAAQNDSVAREANLAAPVVSTGQYLSSSSKLSADDLLAQGIEEELKAARKRRAGV